MPNGGFVSTKQSSYLREVRESQKVFSALVHAMEKSHKAVVAAIEERQKEEQKKVQNLVQELEQEIQELTKESAVSDSLVPEKTDQQDELKEDSTVSTVPSSSYHHRWQNSDVDHLCVSSRMLYLLDKRSSSRIGPWLP